MSVTIDSLEIEISSNSTLASQGIDTLITSLRDLKSACVGGANLGEIAKGLKGHK